jgi:hypothetical protein
MPQRIPVDWIMITPADQWLAPGCNHQGFVVMEPIIATCTNCGTQWAPRKEANNLPPIILPWRIAHKEDPHYSWAQITILDANNETVCIIPNNRDIQDAMTIADIICRSVPSFLEDLREMRRAVL